MTKENNLKLLHHTAYFVPTLKEFLLISSYHSDPLEEYYKVGVGVGLGVRVGVGVGVGVGLGVGVYLLIM